nr:MAG TPA: hypothetical protein [Caudoviricetes sp.]
MENDKRVRRIADIAEELGFRVWFSFAVCHIHRMYGPEVARFELDDQQRYWVSSEFLNATAGKYFREVVDHIGYLASNKGSQSRGTLYAMKEQRVSWWSIKELEDGSGVKTMGSESLDSLHTKRDVERIMRRYGIGKNCYIQEVDQDGMFGRKIEWEGGTDGRL